MPTVQPEQLEYESRYKDTATITLEGTFQFELWERPEEIDKMIEFSSEYTVREVDVGRLDLIAYNFYNNVKLWWVIAAVNNIINCFKDMYAGQRIYIPNPADVQAMLARTGIVIDETLG